MERPDSGRFATAALVGLAGLLVAVRVAGLGQYPLAHPDEGFWACGSRNVVLYGDELLDGRLHPFLSPATFVLLAGWFLAVPPDLVTARAFSAAAGLGACLLLALLARREVPGRGWLVAFLFGLSSLAVLPHRLVLLEAHQTFWLVLAAVAWLRPGRWGGGGRRARLWDGAAGEEQLDLPPARLPAHPAPRGVGPRALRAGRAVPGRVGADGRRRLPGRVWAVPGRVRLRIPLRAGGPAFCRRGSDFPHRAVRAAPGAGAGDAGAVARHRRAARRAGGRGAGRGR